MTSDLAPNAIFFDRRKRGQDAAPDLIYRLKAALATVHGNIS